VRSSTSALPPRNGPTSFAGLEALLIAKVPAGFVRQPDDFGDTGPSNLAKAARDDGEPGAVKALRAERFLRGYQRLWMNAADDQIIVFLYQFVDTSGAAADYRRSLREEGSSAPRGASRFAIPGLSPSHATGFAAAVGSRSVAVAIAVTGTFVMQVVCNAKSARGLKTQLVTVASKQFNRL
jgi:hypothetical protein